MPEHEFALIDLIAHPVFVLQPDDRGMPRYVAFNRVARKILGKPLKDIVGKTDADLYPGRMGRVALERHLAVVKSGECKTHDIILPVEDGERMIRTVLNPQLDDAGQVTHIVATSTDETDKHTLRNNRDAMETATRDMEQFVNLAAHDLRAPMRHVATLANMMREDFQDLGEDRLELVGLLEDVSAKTLRLIGEILTHAQAGSMSGDRCRFSLCVLVSEARALVDPFRRADIFAAEGELHADRTVAQILLRNLIDNALKYGITKEASGQGRLLLELEVVNLGLNHVELTFRDNGPGFTDRSLARLNDEAFTQEGGYGLIAIRRLVKRFGGTLKVGNRADCNGALIAVTLPGRWYPADPSREA